MIKINGLKPLILFSLNTIEKLARSAASFTIKYERRVSDTGCRVAVSEHGVTLS